MSIGVWIGVAILIAGTVLAIVVRALRPKEFEPVEMAFDMRALKQTASLLHSQAKSTSADMAQQAKARELNKRLDALFAPTAADSTRSSSNASNQR